MPNTLPRVVATGFAVLFLPAFHARSFAKEDKPSEAEVQGRRLLDEVARTYSAMPGYSDQGRYSTRMKPPVLGANWTKSGELPLDLTFARPNRLVLRFNGFLLVSDGKRMTAFSPGERFAEELAPERIEADSLAKTSLSVFLFEYDIGAVVLRALLGLLSGDEPAKAVLELGDGRIWLEPDLTRDGKTLKVLLLRTPVVKAPFFPGRLSPGSEVRLLIDPGTKLIQRIEVSSTLLRDDNPNAESPSRVLRSLTWDSGAVSTCPVRHGIFAFSPPRGSTKVATFKELNPYSIDALPPLPTGDAAKALTPRGGDADEVDAPPPPAVFNRDVRIAEVTRAIKRNPGERANFIERGELYDQTGDRDRAIADYNAAIRLDPGDAEVFQRRGDCYEAKGDHGRAAADYEEAVKRDPRQVRSFCALGGVRALQGQYDRAVAAYDQAMRLYPHIWVRYSRACVLDDKGDRDRAVADFDEVIKGDPEFVDTYIRRGCARFGKGDFDGALADFDRAVHLSPGEPLMYQNRARVFRKKGDLDRAIADLGVAIALEPEDPTSFHCRGSYFAEEGDHDRAIADLDEAVRLDAKSAYTFIYRGNSYRDKHDLDRAIADFGRAIGLEPRDAYARCCRGYAYKAKGDHDPAIADFNEAIRLDPKHVDSYRGRGYCHEAKAEHDLAIADYDQAIRLEPDAPESYLERGYALEKRGDHGRAVADFNESLRRKPDDPMAYYWRGVAQLSMNERDRAIADFRKVIELMPEGELRTSAEQKLEEVM